VTSGILPIGLHPRVALASLDRDIVLNDLGHARIVASMAHEYLACPVTLAEIPITFDSGFIYSASTARADVPRWSVPLIYGLEHARMSRQVWNERGLGWVVRPALNGKLLQAEAWMNTELAARHAPRTLRALERRQPVRVSISLRGGTVPDHVLILPDGEMGKCPRAGIFL
jgi:hypothetical protein